MKKKAIFIAATGQNVGKTTISLGIFAGLKKRISSVGFIKPVGQNYVKAPNGVEVDKDVLLFKEYFNISSDYSDMSPIICPPGFTKDFLDKKIPQHLFLNKVLTSFAAVEKEHEYVVVEGTGHVGVGSIFDCNNAFIANALDLEVVLIANGGLGSAIDELALNIEMCRAYNVRLRGIILNRVTNNKREMIADYIPKALERWNVPLIGLVPYLPYLSLPTMRDFEGLLSTPLLGSRENELRHYHKTKLVAGSLESYLEEIATHELIITPACREDIILATIEKNLRAKLIGQQDFQCGIILTGNKPPGNEVLEKIKKSDLPILYTPQGSFDTMKQITSFIAKIRKEDTKKIEKAIDLVEHHVNFDLLI